MTRVRRDTIAYLLILAFAILLLVWAIPTYTPAWPGYGASPALVPIVSACIVVAMCLLAFLRNALAAYGNRELPPEEREFPDDAQSSGFTQVGRINPIHLLSFMVPCGLLVAGIEYVGYLPAALIFLLLIQYIIGSRNWLQMTIVAIAAVAVLYAAMRYGFGVPVPGRPLF